MASYKVYRSGNNYEVYEYEEPAHNNLEHVQIFNEKKTRLKELELMIRRYENKLDRVEGGGIPSELYGKEMPIAPVTN